MRSEFSLFLFCEVWQCYTGWCRPIEQLIEVQYSTVRTQEKYWGSSNLGVVTSVAAILIRTSFNLKSLPLRRDECCKDDHELTTKAERSKVFDTNYVHTMGELKARTTWRCEVYEFFSLNSRSPSMNRLTSPRNKSRDKEIFDFWPILLFECCVENQMCRVTLRKMMELSRNGDQMLRLAKINFVL